MQLQTLHRTFWNLTSQRPSLSVAAGDRRIIPIATALTDGWSNPKNGRHAMEDKNPFQMFQSFQSFQPFPLSSPSRGRMKKGDLERIG
jgi:hypothetical protein